MEPINEVVSVITPLDRKNVDTDQIISKEFLKRIERTGFGKYPYALGIRKSTDKVSTSMISNSKDQNFSCHQKTQIQFTSKPSTSSMVGYD